MYIHFGIGEYEYQGIIPPDFDEYWFEEDDKAQKNLRYSRAYKRKKTKQND